MAVKSFRPLTPSRRYMTVSSFAEITKTRPEKKLVVIRKRSGGRNAHARVTARGIGGGQKQKNRPAASTANQLGGPRTAAATRNMRRPAVWP